MTAREWQAFQDRGSAAPDRVRVLIRDSWARSRSSGIDPEALGIRVADIDADTEFLRAGSRVLLGMSDVLLGTRTSLALTDAAGNIAWRWEPDASLGRQFDRTEIHVGSAMAEDRAGTNGIAVALHERRPATVIGTEHFKQAWHGWACAAAPVIHPVGGQVLGAVNIACHAPDANNLLPVVLRGLTNGVRDALRESASSRERRLMDAHIRMQARVGTGVVTLDAHTMIVGDDAASLGLEREPVWSLLREAPAARELELAPGVRASVHPVTEGRPGDGCVLVPMGGPGGAGGIAGGGAEPGVAGLTPLQAAERRVIADALRRFADNKSDAADYLGISRGTLYERLRRYGM